MSSSYQSKTLQKPLKGGTVSGNSANFGTINANSVKFESLSVVGLFEDGIFSNIIITDSEIRNTIIGQGGNNVAYFSKLYTTDEVSFSSNVPGASVYWDPNTGIFTISSELNVGGCSQLGNIRICNNDIKATNLNGDINVIPNGLGTIYLNGPIYNKSSNGNFYTEMSNGKIDLLSDKNINLFSSHGSFSLNTLLNQSSISKNGDIELRVDDGLSSKNISTVQLTDGNIIVNTPLNHYLTNGNIITISNNSILNGSYTVGNIISNTSFYLTDTTLSTSTGTGGSLLKSASNNIILNSQNLVTIPSNTKLTLGTTDLYGNTSGLYINSNMVSSGNIYFSTSSIIVPQNTEIQLGTSASNYINFDGSSLNIASDTTTLLTGQTTKINSTNTTFYDPILTIGDYQLNSADNKDRGIEFRYYESGLMKLGWFGYKASSKRFTMMVNATNNNEVITGDIGDFEYNNLYVNSINLLANGIIDVNCGNMLNVNTIYGCSNTLTISGSSNVTINASNRISLNSGTDVLIPNNIPLKFSTNGTLLTETTNGTLRIVSNSNTRFMTASNGSIMIPVDTKLVFDGTTNGTMVINGNTSGELLLKSNNNMYLTTTGGSIIIPQSTNIQLGADSQTINGSTSGINIVSSSGTLNFISNSNVNISSSTGNIQIFTKVGDINLIPTSGNVRIGNTTKLIFSLSNTDNNIGLTNNNLVLTGGGSNTFQVSNYTDIKLLATSNVNINTNTKLNIGDYTYLVSNTSNNLLVNNSSTDGSISVSSLTTNIINTGGTLNVLNTNTYTTTNNYIVTGNTSSLTRFDTANVKMNDPILSLADYNITTPDGKDKGIEYNFRTSTSGALRHGWFGYKDTTGRFTYYSDAINNNEVMSGTLGNIEANVGYFSSLTVTNVGSSLDLNCGNILNVTNLYGCSGDITINSSNSITSNSNNIILNAGSKVSIPFNIPLSFGNTTNSISCNSSGNLTIRSGTVILDANVQINGTTSNVYSTVTNIQDPIISLGGVIGPIVDDNKDRGIEFKWNSSSISKTGFFGFKDSLERFVFIKDGVNTNEVFSGEYSDVQFGNAYLTNISLNSGGNISGISELSGGVISIVSSSGNISLSSSNVIIPYNSKLAFGNTSNSLSANTNGDLLLSANGNISFNTTTNIRYPDNVPIYFGPSNGNYILSSGGNVQLNNTYGNIDLIPVYSSGSVNIPTYNYLNFGSTSNSIYSDGDKLIINGYNGINFNSSSVSFSGDVNIIGTISASNTTFDFNDYILPLGTNQVLNITNIQNSVTGGNIQITTQTPHYLVVGDTVTLVNTNSTPNTNGVFTITSIVDDMTFKVENTGVVFTVNGTGGTVKSKLTTQQGKDVGIQVNYWSTTGNSSVTSGTLGYKTGFFGFDQSKERWSFFTDATISNSVVSGLTGDIDVNKVFTDKMSGYILEGTLSGGSNLISGTNFAINGGNINSTPIGVTTAQSGRFTTLSNTVTASFTGVTLQSTLAYSLTDKYTLSNAGVQFRSPSNNSVVSMFSVTGVNYTGSSGTMPSTSIPDGTYKILVCQSMGTGCTHTIYFGPGKLIVPNPINAGSSPTKLVFKRKSQTAQLLFDGTGWILLNSGAYAVE
jgi:hypothetical protein